MPTILAIVDAKRLKDTRHLLHLPTDRINKLFSLQLVPLGFKVKVNSSLIFWIRLLSLLLFRLCQLEFAPPQSYSK